MLPSPAVKSHHSSIIWWNLTRSGQPWRLQPCVTVPPLSGSISSCCIFHPQSPFSHCRDSKCHWFLSSKSPRALIWTLQKKKKSSQTLRATASHKTHPWVQCTAFMIYITIRNQRSPSVKNVSWVWKSSSLFSPLAMGIDGERVNGNDSHKRFLMSFLTS